MRLRCRADDHNGAAACVWTAGSKKRGIRCDREVDGDVAALQETLSLLDNFEFWFNIVTP
jgi:alkyl sulfatase BDS1-like metallo-beta-lactamase superfamily hydrolase